MNQPYFSSIEMEAPLRERFHQHLVEQGFAPQTTPQPSHTYPGAHTQMLWECWLAATLVERSQWNDRIIDKFHAMAGWQAEKNRETRVAIDSFGESK